MVGCEDRRMRKQRFAISLAALGLAAAAGGGAYAAARGGGSASREQSLIADVAQRLHVTPTQLTDAVKAAMADQIDAAVRAGRLTQAQANELKQRIQQAPGLPFGPMFGPPGPHGFGFRGPGEMHGAGLILDAAAPYLGLSEDQLRQQLRSGKSLAQVASAQHKSVSGLEQAITSAVRSRLDKAVAAGRITKAQEQQRLSRLSQALPSIVNRPPPPLPPVGGPHFGGPGPRPDGPQFGGPGPGPDGPQFGGPGPGPGGPGGYGGSNGPSEGEPPPPPGA
jgi:hypothetical protein